MSVCRMAGLSMGLSKILNFIYPVNREAGAGQDLI